MAGRVPIAAVRTESNSTKVFETQYTAKVAHPFWQISVEIAPLIIKKIIANPTNFCLIVVVV